MRRESFADRFETANRLMAVCIQDAIKLLHRRGVDVTLETMSIRNVDLSDDGAIASMVADLIDEGSWYDIGKILEMADDEPAK